MDEYFEGEWMGQPVRVKRVWSGHYFTDDEIVELLAGNEIEIDAASPRTGEAFRCAGLLSEQGLEGSEFVGFERTRFIEDESGPPDEPDDDVPDDPDDRDSGAGPMSIDDPWCGYAFDYEEQELLLAGKTVTKEKAFTSASGRRFSAQVRWDKELSKICVVEFLR